MQLNAISYRPTFEKRKDTTGFETGSLLMKSKEEKHNLLRFCMLSKPKAGKQNKTMPIKVRFHQILSGGIFATKTSINVGTQQMACIKQNRLVQPYSRQPLRYHSLGWLQLSICCVPEQQDSNWTKRTEQRQFDQYCCSWKPRRRVRSKEMGYIAFCCEKTGKGQHTDLIRRLIPLSYYWRWN